MKSLIVSVLVASCLTIGAAQAQSRTGSTSEFLQEFEGEFRGGGTLVRNNQPTNLDCQLSGRSGGRSLQLAGTCRANIFAGANISISVRHDPARNRYVGIFRDGLGTISSLSGTRRGNSLSFLAVETAESVRPDPPARLVLSQRPGGISLEVRNTVPGRGSTIALILNRA